MALYLITSRYADDNYALLDGPQDANLPALWQEFVAGRDYWADQDEEFVEWLKTKGFSPVEFQSYGCSNA
jgi:hypothetical protein